MSTTLTIPARFNGPPGSANGGVACGLLAALVPDPGAGAVQVTLRRPPPLERALNVRTALAETQLRDGDQLVATAIRTGVDALGDAVPPVDPATATEAATGYPGLDRHPFPTCFSCGPARPQRDGLGLCPGPLHGDRGRTATPFVLREAHLEDDPAAGPPVWVVWAALDCPGGWTIDQPNRPAVLGRMTARVTRLPALGEPCVVVGIIDLREGRRSHTRTTVYGPDGRELGRAAATWIDVRLP